MLERGQALDLAHIVFSVFGVLVYPSLYSILMQVLGLGGFRFDSGGGRLVGLSFGRKRGREGGRGGIGQMVCGVLVDAW